MKEICIKVTFDFEDESEKAVDLARMTRAIRRGFPYALGGEIDVEEIDSILSLEGFNAERAAWERRENELKAALLQACALPAVGHDNILKWRALAAGTSPAREAPAVSEYDRGFENALEFVGRFVYEKGEWKDSPHNRRADILRMKPSFNKKRGT